MRSHWFAARTIRKKWCVTHETSFFRYYLLTLMIVPVLFYIPKFFEVRTKEVVVAQQAAVNCTAYVEFREGNSGAFGGFAHQYIVNRNFSRFPKECTMIPEK